ncbi:MAG: hypothetical protein HC847_09910 [Hydrococcus sp. RU_2_2]|nr:hypothetical protein [Hydrococcus sp. RU_2_2]
MEFFPNLPGGSALSDSGASVPCHLIYQIFEGIFNDRSPIPLNGYVSSQEMGEAVGEKMAGQMMQICPHKVMEMEDLGIFSE